MLNESNKTIQRGRKELTFIQHAEYEIYFLLENWKTLREYNVKNI